MLLQSSCCRVPLTSTITSINNLFPLRCSKACLWSFSFLLKSVVRIYCKTSGHSLVSAISFPAWFCFTFTSHCSSSVLFIYLQLWLYVCLVFQQNKCHTFIEMSVGGEFWWSPAQPNNWSNTTTSTRAGHTRLCPVMPWKHLQRFSTSSWLMGCSAAHLSWSSQPSRGEKDTPQQEWGWYKRVITGNQWILQPFSWLPLLQLITGPPGVKGKKKERLGKVHTELSSGPKHASPKYCTP